MRFIIVFLLAFLIACNPPPPKGTYTCKPDTDCPEQNGSCFTCNQGYVCGFTGTDGCTESSSDTTCCKRDPGPGPFYVRATECTSGDMNYLGNSHFACFNELYHAHQNGCSKIETNCR